MSSLLLFSFILLHQIYWIFLLMVFFAIILIAYKHESNSATIGQYGFLGNWNIFHEVILPLSAFGLFIFHKPYVGIIYFMVLLVLFKDIRSWLVAGIKKLF